MHLITLRPSLQMGLIGNVDTIRWAFLVILKELKTEGLVLMKLHVSNSLNDLNNSHIRFLTNQYRFCYFPMTTRTLFSVKMKRWAFSGEKLIIE